MTVFLKTFLLLFFPSHVFFHEYTFVESNEFCEKDDFNCMKNANNIGEENKYQDTSFVNQILKSVAQADSYQECPFSNCSCYLSVLNDDLKPFQSGITQKMIDDVRSRGVTYVIYNNKLYREKFCLFPSRCSGVEYFLKQLLPKLKNSELIINTRDWPQVSSYFQVFGPVLSFSKTKDYLDIMYPAWSFWEGGPAIKTYPTGLGKWNLHRKSLTDEFLKWPWNKKKSIA